VSAAAPLVVTILAIVLTGADAARAAEAAPDTLRLRLEAGVGTDITNEQFYEDAFLADTLFLGRRLTGTPETRHAGVLDLDLQGTRGDGFLQYRLHHVLSVGDRLTRGLLDLSGTCDVAPDWRFQLAPSVEYRRDRTFGRDLTEARGGTTARLRHRFRDEDTFAELGLGGDFLRTSGRGADFIPDRDAGLLALVVERAGLDAGEWRAGWRLAARAFPDSSERNHLEHGWEARWRHVTAAGHALTLEGEGARRTTRRAAPTARDRFWEAQAAVEAELGTLSAWTWRARLEGEVLRYEQQDSVLYLDASVLRARLGPRWQDSGGRSVSLAARGERLTSPRDPGEDYDEAGGELTAEWLGLRGWWSVAPAAGWRQYRDTSAWAAGSSLPGVHSSFAFYEVTLFGDQPLPGALRLRVSGAGRVEVHTDRTQDTRSLYFSVDLRRLF